MKREWKPGDVAMIVHPAGIEELALCVRPGVTDRGTSYRTARWRVAVDTQLWSSVVDARPLVVIDPEDREQVGRLAEAVGSGMGMLFGVGKVQAALREFASPTPPKPDEPTGLGAVVEASYQDADGKGFGPAKWAAREDGTWVCLTDGMSAHCVGWPFLQDVTVLSEGVTPC